jgi:hypothetical protein
MQEWAFGDQVDQALAGDGALDHSAEAFAGPLVGDRGDLDRASLGGGLT